MNKISIKKERKKTRNNNVTLNKTAIVQQTSVAGNTVFFHMYTSSIAYLISALANYVTLK